MVAIGYTLCSEKHRPDELVRFGQRAEAAGFDVAMHQIGPDQEGFFRFYEREIIPKLGKAPRGRKAA
jgi:hypothetical protein